MTTGIIGSGIAGLAAAIRMAVRGQQVTVFEANPYPGGKLSSFDLQGYRFDAGPSLFTMPQYVDDLFRLAGEDPKDHFEYERLPTVCNYFWEDGTRLSAYGDQEKFAKEAAEKLGVSEATIQQQLKDSARKYEVTGKIFLEKSLHKAEPFRYADPRRRLYRRRQGHWPLALLCRRDDGSRLCCAVDQLPPAGRSTSAFSRVYAHSGWDSGRS